MLLDSLVAAGYCRILSVLCTRNVPDRKNPRLDASGPDDTLASSIHQKGSASMEWLSDVKGCLTALSRSSVMSCIIQLEYMISSSWSQ
ncbi:hypothetical protein Tco_0156529 [Tanacetum coccineum]